MRKRQILESKHGHAAVSPCVAAKDRRTRALRGATHAVDVTAVRFVLFIGLVRL